MKEVSDTDLTQLSITQASELVRQRVLSPLALTRAYLERIETHDKQINSFITLDREGALLAAGLAEAEIGRGEWRGLLHGIPVGLKDLFATRGQRTTAGALFWRGHVSDDDAFLVKRLRAAGAVLLGKLNMHEIALGVTNINPHYGAVRNPWNTACISGGSSGGSAAALAAGFCAGALGSDTGGSIRIPAALCGIVGLKPTYGRLSLRGVVPLSWNLDHAGPMGREVRDVALLLQALVAHDPDDPYASNRPGDDYLDLLQAGVSGWRIGLVTDAFVADAVDPEVWQAVQSAAQVFRNLGAEVVPLELPDALDAARANGLVTTSDAAAYHNERIKTTPEQFGVDVLERLQRGAAFTSSEYILARHRQARLRHAYAHLLQEYNLLMLPSTPIVANPIDGLESASQAPALTRFTAPFNLTGLPAISLPCGFSGAGLPVGMQLVGHHWGEAELLQAAFAYEQAAGWHTYHPRLPETAD